MSAVNRDRYNGWLAGQRFERKPQFLITGVKQHQYRNSRSLGFGSEIVLVVDGGLAQNGRRVRPDLELLFPQPELL